MTINKEIDLPNKPDNKISVADVFNIQDRGSIKEGYFADIVIWSDDPLEPSAYPTTVIINGDEMSLATRASRLTERYTDKRDLPSAYKH